MACDDLARVVWDVAKNILAEEPKNIYAKHLLDQQTRLRWLAKRLAAMLPPE